MVSPDVQPDRAIGQASPHNPLVSLPFEKDLVWVYRIDQFAIGQIPGGDYHLWPHQIEHMGAKELERFDSRRIAEFTYVQVRDLVG